jgi:hypothetical protein
MESYDPRPMYKAVRLRRLFQMHLESLTALYASIAQTMLSSDVSSSSFSTLEAIADLVQEQTATLCQLISQLDSLRGPCGWLIPNTLKGSYLPVTERYASVVVMETEQDGYEPDEVPF